MNELHPIDRAIAAHARWKSNLRLAIQTGKSESTVEQAHRDDACALGHWLIDRPQHEKHGEHFRNVHDLHSRFHREAAHVLELALAGKRTEATAAMAIDGSFTAVSVKLTAALTAWKKVLDPK